MSPAAVLSILVQANTAQATAALQRVDAQAKKTAASTNAAGSAMGGKLAKGAKVGGAALGALAVYGLYRGVKAGAEFEKQMDSLGAVTEASGRQMGKLEKQALKLGQATVFSANEVAEAQTSLAKGGLTVKQVLGGALPAALSLAAAGELDLATAADTTANALNLFGLKGKEAQKIADMMATAANTTTADVIDFAMALKQGGSAAKIAGLDLNNTMVILEALAKSGIKNSDAGTSMKAALIQLLKPSKKQAELAAELGIQWTNQAGVMKGAVGISKELRLATEGMTKAERAKTLATLAGTDGFRALAALYDVGPAKLKRLAKANEEAGTAQEIARKKMDNLSGDAEQLGGSLETLGIKASKLLNPALRALVQAATSAVNAVGSFNLRTPTQGAIAFGLASVAVVAGLTKLVAVAAAARVALVATFALMERHPLGLLAIGAGIAAGALFGLVRSSNKASDAQERLKRAMKDQHSAFAQIANANQRLSAARQRQAHATRAEKAAEDRLAAARRDHGPTSWEAVRAEIALARRKRDTMKATREVRDAERKRGVELEVAKALLRSSVRVQAGRVRELRLEKLALTEAWRNSKLLGDDESKRLPIGRKLVRVNRELNQASHNLNSAYAKAAKETNPKFTRTLRDSGREISRLRPTTRSAVAGLEANMDRLLRNQEDMVNTTGRGLGIFGQNFNSALGVLGARTLDFQIKQFKGKNQRKQQGGFMVPGSGSGDVFKTVLPEGAFVMNREATKALGLRRGGMMPVALEPGEGVFMPEEVKRVGAKALDAANKAVPRFQRGGMPGKPTIAGPQGSLLDLGQGAIDKTYAAAKKFFDRHKGALGGLPGKLGEAMALARSFGLEITSTTGGQHASDSWHYKGRAFDASNGVNTPEMKQYALAAARRWGKHILELFYDPLGWYIKNGSKVAGSIGGHSDHVHTAMQLGGLLLRRFAEGGKLVGASTYGGPADSTSGTVGASGVSLPGKMAFAELDMGKALGELPFGAKLKISRAGRSVVGEKLDIGAGGGPVNGLHRAIDLWYETANALGLPDSWLGTVRVASAGGGSIDELSEGEKKQREAQARKKAREAQLVKLRQAVADAKSTPAKLSKLWKLIKFWGRVGIFDKGEKGHLLDSVQKAASQTSPEGAVKVLSHLAAWSRKAGEITGRDPDEWHSMTDAVQRAQERGQNARERVVERNKRRRARKIARIAARGNFPELVKALEAHESAYDIANQGAERLVALEPEDLSDSYVDQERGAWGHALGTLATWRDKVVTSRDFAAGRIPEWQEQIDKIKALQKSQPKAFKKQKWRIKPLREAIASAQQFISERGEELTDLQGVGGPQGVLGALGEGTPHWLTLGGPGSRIFDTQNTIRELAIKVGTTAIGGDGAGDAERIAALEDLLRQANQRNLVFERHKPIIDAYTQKNFAGMFAKGGTIPAGMWGIAGERGPEPVFGPATVVGSDNAPGAFGSTNVRVEVFDHTTKVYVDDQEIEAVVKRMQRSQGRSAKTVGARKVGRGV